MQKFKEQKVKKVDKKICTKTAKKSSYQSRGINPYPKFDW